MRTPWGHDRKDVPIAAPIKAAESMVQCAASQANDVNPAVPRTDWSQEFQAA